MHKMLHLTVHLNMFISQRFLEYIYAKNPKNSIENVIYLFSNAYMF